MRQPVHVVYGGAHLFKSDTTRKLGRLAERALAEYAPDAGMLAEAVGIRSDLAGTVYERVKAKLGREAVEDFRIDFEDGFGTRADAEEDATVDAAAAQLAKGMEEGTLSPFIGLRVKSFGPETKARARRTLQRFLQSAGKLPEEFVVTLPKITAVDEVSEFMEALAPYHNVGVELMIETSLSLRKLTELVDRTHGRCVGAHFGPYDYTASLGITSHNQHLLHPACHFARSTMLMTLAGSGIALSDGPTNIMPIAPHRGEGCITGMCGMRYITGFIRGGMCIRRSCLLGMRRCIRSFSKGWRRLRRGCGILFRRRRRLLWSAMFSMTRLRDRGC
jgi:hypothetical protein